MIFRVLIIPFKVIYIPKREGNVMFGALIYILIFQSARLQSCRLAAFREHSARLKAARAVARDINVVVTIRLQTGCS